MNDGSVVMQTREKNEAGGEGSGCVCGVDCM